MDAQFDGKQATNLVLAQRAKRLVLALDRLIHALNENAGVRMKIDEQMRALFEDVKTLDTFDARSFAGHLQNLRVALGAGP